MDAAQAEATIRRHLAAGEPLLWSGFPRQGVVLRPIDLLFTPFGAAWTAFSLWWLVTARDAASPAPPTALGLLSVTFGLHLTFGRLLLEAVRRGRACYGITARRVLAVSGLLRPVLAEAALQELPFVRFRERSDGSGSIDFGVVVAAAPSFTGSPFRGRRSTLRFDEIARAAAAHGIVRDAWRAARADGAARVEGRPPAVGVPAAPERSGVRALQQAAFDAGWRIPAILPGDPSRAWRPRSVSALPLVGLALFLLGALMAVTARVEGGVAAGLVVAVAGLALSVASSVWSERRRRRDWVPVEATCLDEELAFFRKRNGGVWRWRLLCRFELSGREYTVTPTIYHGLVVDRVLATPERTRAARERAVAFRETFRVADDRVRLWVNPADPLEAELWSPGRVPAFFFGPFRPAERD
jgi:hypothetical protein